MSYYVYEFVNKDGVVFYAGKTVNLKQRMKQHIQGGKLSTPEALKELSYAVVRILDDKVSMDLVERFLIASKTPELNIADKPIERVAIVMNLDSIPTFKVNRETILGECVELNDLENEVLSEHGFKSFGLGDYRMEGAHNILSVVKTREKFIATTWVDFNEYEEDAIYEFSSFRLLLDYIDEQLKEAWEEAGVYATSLSSLFRKVLLHERSEYDPTDPSTAAMLGIPAVTVDSIVEKEA